MRYPKLTLGLVLGLLATAPAFAAWHSVLQVVVSSGGASTTWDAANKAASITLSGGNLVATGSGAAAANVRSVASHTTGKYYAELTINVQPVAGNDGVGIMNGSNGTGVFMGGSNNSMGYYGATGGQVYLNNAVAHSSVGAYTATNVISMAVDVGGHLIWFRVGSGNWNNDILANQNPATGAGGFDISAITGAVFAGVEIEDNLGQWTANFGGSAYAQSVPAGYGNW